MYNVELDLNLEFLCYFSDYIRVIKYFTILNAFSCVIEGKILSVKINH